MKILLALLLRVLTLICAEEELSVEQLNGNDSEDKLEQNVHDQNVDDVFQRVDNAIKHCFQFRNTFDGFQWTQHSKYSKRLDG